jgi:hypothetical protein
LEDERIASGLALQKMEITFLMNPPQIGSVLAMTYSESGGLYEFQKRIYTRYLAGNNMHQRSRTWISKK